MEVDTFGDASQNISAYAKLEFEQFSFFIQTLTLIVGRKAKRDDNVDVHLGMSKSISRVHARIYYQFDAMSWEIEVVGKNGAFVNEHYVEAGGTCALRNTDKLQIAEATFSFLLPEGAVPPGDPLSLGKALDTAHSPQTTNTITPAEIAESWLTTAATTTPIAPHHLMQMTPAVDDSKESLGLQSLTSNGDASNSKAVTIDTIKTKESAQSFTSHQPSDSGIALQSDFPEFAGKMPAKKPRKKYTKKNQSTKVEDADPTLQHMCDDVWPMNQHQMTPSPELESSILDTAVLHLLATNPEEQTQSEEERKRLEEEAAAQHAAQLLHQERLARQAQEEEEGLILPPPETDPAVIAEFQKPPASYATMIYNAITSHEKKKMTLAQIYSWICIYHPYYRYVQNGWQNSIRHNLSLNKAFKKVPRTDDEPGKGSFWAVDPDSEMLFEGGIYKKKPPRPTPPVPVSRGAPVVMKDGKLALNPNYFVGGIQGKAEEVLRLLHFAVQKQVGIGSAPEHASQLARILALALATQLRQSAINSNGARQVPQPVQIQQQQPSNLLRPVATPTRPQQSYGAPITSALSGFPNARVGPMSPATTLVPGTLNIPVRPPPAEARHSNDAAQKPLLLNSGFTTSATLNTHLTPISISPGTSQQEVFSTSKPLSLAQSQNPEREDGTVVSSNSKRPPSDEFEQSKSKMQKLPPIEPAKEAAVDGL